MTKAFIREAVMHGELCDYSNADFRRKLLALDRRTARVDTRATKTELPAQITFRLFAEQKIKASTLQLALRDLLAIHDAEKTTGFCWNDPARKRLEEIRKMAAKP